MHTGIVVTEAQRANANAATQQLDGATSADLTTFAVPVSATGSLPATHWGCALRLMDANRAKVEAMRPMFPGCLVWDYDLENEPDGFETRLVAAGLLRVGGAP